LFLLDETDFLVANLAEQTATGMVLVFLSGETETHSKLRIATTDEIVWAGTEIICLLSHNGKNVKGR
jgi:hypothetical protein